MHLQGIVATATLGLGSVCDVLSRRGICPTTYRGNLHNACEVNERPPPHHLDDTRKGEGNETKKNNNGTPTTPTLNLDLWHAGGKDLL